MFKYFFECLFSILYNISPKMELRDYMDISYLIFCKIVFYSSCTILHSTNKVQGFFSPTITDIIVWLFKLVGSVQFSRSVVSDSLQPHEPQHARPPCPSPNPRVHSNSCPLSRWCYPAISSSVVPFSSCHQYLPTSVFSNKSTLCLRWPKYWSFSFSTVLPKNTQDWSPLGWTG